MDANTRELTRAIEDLRKAIEGPRSFPIIGNQDRINRDSREVNEDSVKSTVQSFEQISRVSRDAIRKEQKRMDSFLKGLGRGTGMLDSLYHRLKKGNAELEQSMRKQGQTYKESARNMEAFTRSTYNNTEKLNDTTKKLDDIDKVTKKLQRSTKEKQQVENEIKQIAQKYLKSQLSLKNNAESLAYEEKRLAGKQFQLSQKLKTAKEDEIEEIKHSIDEIQKARDKMQELPVFLMQKLRSEVEKIKDWNEVDPNDESTKFLKNIYEKIKDGAGSDEEILASLDNINEAIEGAKAGFTAVENKNANKLIALSEKRNRILESLGPTIVAGLAEAGRREFNMMETRQMRMGSQSYSMLPRALAMGMSETDLLTMTDENRYLIRRLALEAGQEGEFAYMTSEFRKEVQALGKDLGFIGADAMRGMLQVADSLRVVGVDANTEMLRDMTSFIKSTHVQFGITQEEMIGAFRSMTEEGLMGIRFMNYEDSVEAMQEEVEARLHLGRLLNQDIETMKRREREMAARITGDPAEMFRRSIMAGVLASQQGFSREDQDLIRRRFRGETMRGEAGRRAARLEEDLRSGAAQFRANEIVEGNPFAAILPHILMDRAGIDIAEATLEAQRRPGQIDERTARTDEAAKSLDTFRRALLRSKEVLRGITESSFAAFAAGIAASVASLIHLAASSAIAGLSLRRLGLGLGPADMGRMGRMGRFAVPATMGISALAIGGTTMYAGRQAAHSQFDAGMISESERDIALREANYTGIGQMTGGTAGGVGGAMAGRAVGVAGGRLAGAWAGAKAGAVAGSFAPGIGNVVGGLVGLGVGLVAGEAIGNALADAQQNRMENRERRQRIMDIATGEDDSAQFALTRTKDGNFKLVRHTLGEVTTHAIDAAHTPNVEEDIERAEILTRRLGSEAYRRTAGIIQVRRDERELEAIRANMVGLAGEIERTELQESRQNIFQLMQSLDAVSPTMRRTSYLGMEQNLGAINQRREYHAALIDEFADIKDDQIAALFSNDQDKLSSFIRTISKGRDEEDEKMTELLDKLTEVLIDIEENTERSADAEEESLTHLMKQMGIASEQFWQGRINEVMAGVGEMSRPRDVSDAF